MNCLMAALPAHDTFDYIYIDLHRQLHVSHAVWGGLPRFPVMCHSSLYPFLFYFLKREKMSRNIQGNQIAQKSQAQASVEDPAFIISSYKKLHL
jgi:hypothetical protein